MHSTPQTALVEALQKAEQFIAGFENDANQPQAKPLLEALRLQIDAETVLRPKPLTLRFTDWRCGHHATRPDDIPVSSPEQASAILWAMSHCISQPGHFRAWLMNDVHAVGAYVTDDYFALANAEKGEFPDMETLVCGNERPVLIYGTAEQIAEINSPAHAEAVSELWFFDSLPAWDGKSYLDEPMATTTLTLVELQELAHPTEWYESSRGEYFSLPPVFKSAEAALEEVRALSAEIAACVQTSELDAAEGSAA